MIWLILGIVILGVLLVLVGPLLRPADMIENDDNDIATYEAEIAQLEADYKRTNNPETQSRMIDLQRQLLALHENKPRKPLRPTSLLINILFAGFIFGGLGLYAMLGRPDLTAPGSLEASTPLATPQTVTQGGNTQQDGNSSLEDLVGQLKQKLDTTQSEDANGWMLYARTSMNLGRFDEAFSAYERVLELTDNIAQVADELARARAFATQSTGTATPATRGPSAADVEAASEMSEADRAAMIEGMVENLAARLVENPEDPEGWARLIRARIVMGDANKLSADMSRLQKTYENRPDILAQIKANAGLPE